ncbi:hypothetical protein [Proteus mirabilis]|uniref:hypothetical protein n=1 Tax=Proteus mirabilis TaxID=584 RepID=UPI0034D5939E
MNPEEIWETSLNPENRHLIQILPKEGEDIDDIMSRYMGGNPTIDFRKEFIKNLSVEIDVDELV